jgi:hypothetical protein
MGVLSHKSIRVSIQQFNHCTASRPVNTMPEIKTSSPTFSARIVSSVKGKLNFVMGVFQSKPARKSSQVKIHANTWISSLNSAKVALAGNGNCH